MSLYLIKCFSIQILYIPCMFAIWLHLEHSCYKIMFYMGLLDMLDLFVFCMLDGILSMLGAVYCSAPDFIYVKGTLMMSANFSNKHILIYFLLYIYLFLSPSGLWLTETSVEVILALNRCLFFVAPNVAICLFGTSERKTTYRTWLWMVPPTLWGINYWIREDPAIFSSLLLIEAWNPHLGYANEMQPNVCFLFICLH